MQQEDQHLIGVKVRSMKMDLNIYGTWRRVGQGTLMMKMYGSFIQLSCLVALYNNIKNHREDGRFLTYRATKRLIRIKKK